MHRVVVLFCPSCIFSGVYRLFKSPRLARVRLGHFVAPYNHRAERGCFFPLVIRSQLRTIVSFLSRVFHYIPVASREMDLMLPPPPLPPERGCIVNASYAHRRGTLRVLKSPKVLGHEDT